MLLIGILIYTICGILTYGVEFAYMQEEFPALAELDYAKDKSRAVCWGLSGPIGLVVSLTTSKFGFKHGLKFW
ncbi:unnamed protein product [marine sediment metagenome]|uniref:Major facilitator superfamily (MFS) profile domain-containing protein n=1 Tax=marine sediment metagenome TaxID=412755 RepID=X0SXF6_9ZZZZ